MYDAVLSLSERIVHQHSYTGAVPTQQGNGHPLLCPFDILPTGDGWVALAANDHQWEIVANVIGRPDMATVERYSTNAARVDHRDEVIAVLGSWLAAHSTEEVVRAFGGSVPIGPVNTAADIFADPHVVARGMLVSLEQPGSDRPVTVAGQAIKMTGTPGSIDTRGPLLGEDEADQILAEWSETGAAPRAH
jgi:crotonobetainyl-CoA:carnitine CoA-transferase CaiB-like acyl-CoA transferase